MMGKKAKQTNIISEGEKQTQATSTLSQIWRVWVEMQRNGSPAQYVFS